VSARDAHFARRASGSFEQCAVTIPRWRRSCESRGGSWTPVGWSLRDRVRLCAIAIRIASSRRRRSNRRHRNTGWPQPNSPPSIEALDEEPRRHIETSRSTGRSAVTFAGLAKHWSCKSADRAAKLPVRGLSRGFLEADSSIWLPSQTRVPVVVHRSFRTRCLDERRGTHMRDTSGRDGEPRTSSTACSPSPWSSTIARRTPKRQRSSRGCSGPNAVTHCWPSSAASLNRGLLRTAICDGARRMSPSLFRLLSRWHAPVPRRKRAWLRCVTAAASRASGSWGSAFGSRFLSMRNPNRVVLLSELTHATGAICQKTGPLCLSVGPKRISIWAWGPSPLRRSSASWRLSWVLPLLSHHSRWAGRSRRRTRMCSELRTTRPRWRAQAAKEQGRPGRSVASRPTTRGVTRPRKSGSGSGRAEQEGSVWVPPAYALCHPLVWRGVDGRREVSATPTRPSAKGSRYLWHGRASASGMDQAFIRARWETARACTAPPWHSRPPR